MNLAIIQYINAVRIYFFFYSFFPKKSAFRMLS